MAHSIQNFKQKSHSGFTLIELLLYISISSVLLLILSVFLSSLLHARIKNQTIAEVDQQGTQIMHLLAQTARNAEAIASPGQGATIGSLTLNTLSAVNDPTVFDLSAGAIRITEGVGSPVPLTNSRMIASGLSFQNLSHSDTPGTVRIQFTLAHLNPAGRNEYSFTKTFISSATLRLP